MSKERRERGGWRCWPSRLCSLVASMSARCKTCRHDERARIELFLARHVPLEKIGARFGLSIATLHRHRRDHMPKSIKAAFLFEREVTNLDLDELRRTEGESLLQKICYYAARITAQVNFCEEAGDYRGAATLWGRLLDAWELEAKFLGELGISSKTVINNLTISPQWIMLRAELVRVLRDYPEAASAIAEVLQKLELPEDMPLIDARPNGTGGHDVACP